MTRPAEGQLAAFVIDVDPSVENRRHVERVTAHHRAHAISGRPHPDCLECQTAPPAPVVLRHPFAELPTKWRTAAHLEFAHGDRSLHSNAAMRHPLEFTELHRSLHDAGR